MDTPDGTELQVDRGKERRHTHQKPSPCPGKEQQGIGRGMVKRHNTKRREEASIGRREEEEAVAGAVGVAAKQKRQVPGPFQTFYWTPSSMASHFAMAGLGYFG